MNISRAHRLPAYPVLLSSPAVRVFGQPGFGPAGFFLGWWLLRHACSLVFLPAAGDTNGYELFAEVRHG